VLKKNYYLVALAIIFLILNTENSAQVIPEIITDRPDLTDSPIVMPLNFFQIESGVVYEKQRFKDGNSNIEIENFTLGSTLFRYGLMEILEFRFGGEYLIGKTTVDGVPTNTQGLQNIFIGAKLQLRKDRDLLSNAGLIFELGLPLGSEVLRHEKIEPGIVIALEQDFTDQLSLGINIRASNDSNLSKNIYGFSASLNYGIMDEIGVFTEYFSNLVSDFSPQHNLDVGFTYVLKKNLQVDASVGTIFLNDDTDWFCGLGISVKLPR